MIYKLNKKKLHLFLGYCILKIILIQIFCQDIMSTSVLDPYWISDD